MSEKHREHNERKTVKWIAQNTKQKLILLISFLGAIALILIFRVGKDIWPDWLVDYCAPIIGVVLFAAFVLIAASPLIIEANSNPRKLSGPGHNPELPPSSWKP